MKPLAAAVVFTYLLVALVPWLARFEWAKNAVLTGRAAIWPSEGPLLGLRECAFPRSNGGSKVEREAPRPAEARAHRTLRVGAPIAGAAHPSGCEPR